MFGGVTVTASESVWDRRRQFVVSEFEIVALELFAEKGFRAVTVDDIAEAAGVSARTLFRYFPTKEDYLLGRPRRWTAETMEAIRALEPSNAPLEAVWQFTRHALIEEPPDITLMNLWRRAALDAPEVVDRLRGERVQAMLGTVTVYCATCLDIDPLSDPRPRLLAGIYAGFEIALIETLGQPDSTMPDLLAAADRSIAAWTHLAATI
jgi:AcrR family transcriptional regulator